jgi:hypothetical protein
MKPWISIAVSIAKVVQWKLDMVPTIFKRSEALPIFIIPTGLFVSGGSTGVCKFFKRVSQLKHAMEQQKLVQAKTVTSDPQ